MRRLLVGLIRIYHNYISHNTLPACRYHPSCSEYACQAIEKKGIIKGAILGVYRIIRCNPFSRGGYDPVR